MNTQSGAARPFGWLIRKGDSDVWAYCDNEEDADFYGKQSGLKYEKLALYTAADYDALRDELARMTALRDGWGEKAKEALAAVTSTNELNEKLVEKVESWRKTAAENFILGKALTARAEAAEAKVARLASLRREYRPSMDKDTVHSWATDVVAALNEGEGK
jgi:uncharacterized protein (DUF885 family)